MLCGFAKLQFARHTFAKGETPPVIGFWSITMYEVESDGWWFVPNPLNKFTVSARNNLKYNADGSVTLYFQNESPGKDKEANWLPAPKGVFIPMLRMYWPKDTPPSIIDGTWKPPAVNKWTKYGRLAHLAIADMYLRTRQHFWVNSWRVG